VGRSPRRHRAARRAPLRRKAPRRLIAPRTVKGVRSLPFTIEQRPAPSPDGGRTGTSMTFLAVRRCHRESVALPNTASRTSSNSSRRRFGVASALWPRRAHEKLARTSARQTLPERFGHERHHRMQQAKRAVERVHEHRARHVSITARCVEPGFHRL
jgi:hypothetical protein